MALLLFGAMTSCATSGLQGGGTSEISEIRLELGPCFGFCPVFRAEIGANGQGTYTGTNFVAIKGEHSFMASSEEFSALADRLAPIRPATSQVFDRSNCDGPVATDNPTIKVTWVDATGEEVSLDWYMGCRQPGLLEQRDRIYDAWQEIAALAELVGMSDNRREYRDK